MRQERSAAACSLPSQDRILVQRCMVFISPWTAERRKGEKRRTERLWRRLVKGTFSWAGMTPCSPPSSLSGKREYSGRRRVRDRLTVFEELRVGRRPDEHRFNGGDNQSLSNVV